MAEDEFDFSDIDFTPFIRSSYFEKSIEELMDDVKTNNRFAAYELGRRLKAKNELNTAYQYFSLSAELGDTDAPMEAALIAGKQERYQDAGYFLEMQIERTNDAKAHTLLGRYYVSGKIGGIFKRNKLGFQHFLAAAQQGHPEAQYLLALNYYEGRGTRHSLQDFTFWIRCAQLNGYQPATHFMDRWLKTDAEYTRIWDGKLAKVEQQIMQYPQYIPYYRRQ